MDLIPFSPNANTSLSATSSSTSIALPGVGPVLWLQNVGTIEAFVRLGTNSAVAAATTDFSVPSGRGVMVNAQGFSYLAGITSTSTTTVRMSQGTGVPLSA